MFWVITTIESLMFPSHQPQEISLITRRTDGCVISEWEFHKLIIFYSVSFIHRTICSIYTLHPKTLLWVKLEVINFFRNTFVRHIIHIMLMWWESCPISICHISLTNGKYFCVGTSINKKTCFSHKRLLTKCF